MKRFGSALLVVSALGLATLAGCSEEQESTKATESRPAAGKDSLAEAIGKADGMDVVSDALGDTGIAEALEGRDSYTLLVPPDGAFSSLGEAGEALKGKEGRPAMAALLREHILPGYVTPADLSAAIAAADDGKASLRTLGDGQLVFSKSGDAIIVTAADGSSARLQDRTIQAGSSLAIPVDGILKKL